MDDTSVTPETAAAPPAESGASPASTAEALASEIRAESPTFTQADLQAKIAESQKAWEAERDKQYGWAKDLTAETYQQHRAIADRATTDPIGYAQELMRQAASNPQFAPAIQGLMQRMAGASGSGSPAGNQSATAPALEAPGPDLRVQNADGTITQMYSAEQMAKYGNWLRDSLRAEVGETVKPLAEFHQQSVAERQADEASRQQTAAAHSFVTGMRQQPGFTEHEKAITDAYRVIVEQQPGREFASEAAAINALWSAYNSVVYAKVSAQGQSEALADHARRAAASTARPSGGAPLTPTRDNRPAEQQLESHLRAALGAKRAG